MKNKPNEDLNHGKVTGEVRQIPLDCIIPNRYQPRKTIEKESLQELIDSIRTHGVLQPIVVRQCPKSSDKYEIIMGERRFRSCEALKKATIPAVVKPANERQMMEWALIENTHRKDLNPIERAKAYQLLVDTFNLTHEEVAKRVGVDRSTVTNFIRLLTLPPEIQADIGNQTIRFAHALTILSVPDSTRRLALWQRVKNEDLSVRHLKILVDSYLHPRGVSVNPRSRSPQYKEFHPGNDPELHEPYARLIKKLPPDATVHINYGQFGEQFIFGSVSVGCRNKDELMRILKILSG
ncbi:MAG TPA: ParB/RepB/Spo0J family partition protein [Planctomycetota bacterium]|nr:ParB/RepB/Spo0J family partition protein [Planctomycetota bacterium]